MQSPKMGPSAVGLRRVWRADMKSQSLTGDCWGWGKKEESDLYFY